MPHPLDSKVSLVLSGLDAPGYHPYSQWEDCFVQRWNMVPDTSVPDLAAEYMRRHGKDPRALSCVEALRVFHVNQFLPRPEAVVRKFVHDYRNVPPEIVEPTWENDPHTGDRLERYLEKHDPNGRLALGRQVFDMGRGAQPR